MSKNPPTEIGGQPVIPDFGRGTWRPSMLATEGEKNETARSLPVNGPIWSTTLPVNENLHFFVGALCSPAGLGRER
jgi:hypothetical protein